MCASCVYTSSFLSRSSKKWRNCEPSGGTSFLQSLLLWSGSLGQLCSRSIQWLLRWGAQVRNYVLQPYTLVKDCVSDLKLCWPMLRQQRRVTMKSWDQKVFCRFHNQSWKAKLLTGFIYIYMIGCRTLLHPLSCFNDNGIKAQASLPMGWHHIRMSEVAMNVETQIEFWMA